MFNFSRQALKRRLVNDPYYRFQSLEEVAMAAELGISIDVNQATVDDWLRLPGISIHQARHLVALREGGLQFFCLEDLAAALATPVPRLKPLGRILSFVYYDNHAALTPQTYAINSATALELADIPVLDPSWIQRILDNRQQQGPFLHLVDLQKRLQVPPDLLSHLMHYLRF